MASTWRTSGSLGFLWLAEGLVFLRRRRRRFWCVAEGERGREKRGFARVEKKRSKATAAAASKKKKKKKKKTKTIRMSTHGFRSLGLRRRLTSANLRVFLALPMVVGEWNKLGRRK